MSDDEVQARTSLKILWHTIDFLTCFCRFGLTEISTFFVAGRATTSSALAWAIYSLSLAPSIQSRLRDEVLAVPTSTPSFDELNALPFLDAVIHETLRVFSPVPGSMRLVQKDTILPMQDNE